MPAASLSTSKILKSIYASESDLVAYGYSDPLLGLIKKSTNFGGEDKKVPVRYAHTAGRSHSFDAAKANKNSSKKQRFVITQSKNYSLWSIDDQLIASAQGDMTKIIDPLREEFDEAMAAFMSSMHTNLYRNHGGYRGQISSISTNVVTLTDINDIVNLYPGMVLQTSTTDGTSGSVNSGTVTVTKVDQTLGKITASANWTTGIPAALANDYIFVEGDFGNAFYGLADWFPVTAPSATLYFGVDRTVSEAAMSGSRVTAGSLNVKEAIQKLLQVTNRNIVDGKWVDAIIINDARYLDLEFALGERIQYTERKGEPIETSKGKIEVNVGFRGIKFGNAVVYASAYCPYDLGYALRTDMLHFETAGRFPDIVGKDDNSLLVEENADAREGRIKAYGQLWTNAPSHFGVLDF